MNESLPHRLTAWFTWVLIQFAAAATPAAEPVNLRPLDLVGSDAAVLCEVSRPKAQWEAFRDSELAQRFARSGLLDQLRKTAEFRQLEKVEESVAAATGRSLSSQLWDLFHREVALAAYLSAQHQPQPQGVLIAQADDAAAVDRFLQTWKTLEPHVETQSLKHQGQTYHLRPASGGRKANLFYVTFGPIFALSDHESRIRQVIDLQQLSTQRSTGRNEPIVQHPLYQRANSAATHTTASIRVLMFARAWDGVWGDSAPDDAGAKLLQRIWSAVEVITVELRTAEGLQLEVHGLLNTDQTDELWRSWSAAIPDPRTFLDQVPADAVLVAAGGIHFAPLWQTIEQLADEGEQDDWNKGRRILRGILGGRDLLTDVLPALTQQFGLYVVPKASSQEFLPFDGVLTLQFMDSERSPRLNLVLDQALSSVLTLLSVQSAERFPDEEPASVQTSLDDGAITRWLETSRPFRVAYQSTASTLRLSRSPDQLRPSSNSLPANKPSPFAAYCDRWFATADVFACLDIERLRQEKSVAAIFLPGAADQENQKLKPKQLALRLLDLGDVFYLAIESEPSRFTARVGLVTQ